MQTANVHNATNTFSKRQKQSSKWNKRKIWQNSENQKKTKRKIFQKKSQRKSKEHFFFKTEIKLHKENSFCVCIVIS